MDWIFGGDFLVDSPSRRDDVPAEVERVRRAKSAWFIEELGKELELHRLVVSTAQVFFHRFFALQSFKQHDRFIISAASIFLAAKVEESIQKLTRKPLQGMTRAYIKVKKIFEGISVSNDSEVKEIENQILMGERILLQTLGFDLQIVHPFASIFEKIRLLKSHIAEERRKDFQQDAMNFANDSFRTTLCLQYTPQQIAVGVIFLVTLYLQLKPINPVRSSSEEHTWLGLLGSIDPDMDEEILKSICTQIMDLYETKDMSQFAVVNKANTAQIKASIFSLGCDQRTAPSSATRSDVTDAEMGVDDENYFETPPTFAAGEERARNVDDADEVDLTAPYPYENAEPSRKQPNVRVTVVPKKSDIFAKTSSGPPGHATSSPIPPPPEDSPRSAGSPPPPPPPDTPASSYRSESPPPPPPDTPSSAYYPSGVHAAPIMPMDTPSSLASPPPPPPDTPASLASPPPPAPDTPQFYSTGTGGPYYSSQSAMPPPPRPRAVAVSSGGGDESPPPPPPAETDAGSEEMASPSKKPRFG